MATVTHDDLQVCTPCALIIANGDTSILDGEGRDVAEHLARMDATMIPGAWVIDPDGEDFNPFGTRRCDACGDTDAGERYPAVILDGPTDPHPLER